MAGMIRVFEKEKKLEIIREILGFDDWAPMAKHLGIPVQKLQRLASGGTEKFSHSTVQLLADTAGFDVNHESWIDHSIPTEIFHRKNPGRKDTAGAFQDYIFPLNGRQVRKHYLRSRTSEDMETKPIFGFINNDRQGKVAIQDFPISAEISFRPIPITQSVSFGFSKIRLSLAPGPDSRQGDLLDFTGFFNENAQDCDLDDNHRITKPKQVNGAFWEISSKQDRPLNGDFEFPPDRPLALVKPMLENSGGTDPADMRLRLLGNQFDGTIVDVDGALADEENKKLVLKALVGEALEKQTDEGAGWVELSRCTAEIDYRFSE